MIDLTNERILLTGSSGFLGKHVYAELAKFTAPANIFPVGRKDGDLRFMPDVRNLMKRVKPTVIIHLAALCGGIQANRRNPVNFMQDNLFMGLNLLMAQDAFPERIRKFVYVSTTCAYPDACPVPFLESDLWSGYPTISNAPYGIAKRTIMELARQYNVAFKFPSISLIPANLYGMGDSFDDAKSHVIPALIKRFVDASERGDDEVVVWGTGNATREFLYASDAAEAIVLATRGYDGPEPMNIGSGSCIRIEDLAVEIGRLCGFKGRITFDPSHPDGQMDRRLDTSRATAELGWTATTALSDGLQATIDWYKANRT